jgi:hypothetical protein
LTNPSLNPLGCSGQQTIKKIFDVFTETKDKKYLYIFHLNQFKIPKRPYGAKIT